MPCAKWLMDRRKFLTSLIGGVAAAAAVRTFPFRVFSFPTEIVWPPDCIAVQALAILNNKLQIAEQFRWGWRRDFENNFTVGDTVTIKIPQRFVTAEAPNFLRAS
jgi:hypothetical protein